MVNWINIGENTSFVGLATNVMLHIAKLDNGNWEWAIHTTHGLILVGLLIEIIASIVQKKTNNATFWICVVAFVLMITLIIIYFTR